MDGERNAYVPGASSVLTFEHFADIGCELRQIDLDHFPKKRQIYPKVFVNLSQTMFSDLEAGP